MNWYQTAENIWSYANDEGLIRSQVMRNYSWGVTISDPGHGEYVALVDLLSNKGPAFVTLKSAKLYVEDHYK